MDKKKRGRPKKCKAKNNKKKLLNFNLNAIVKNNMETIEKKSIIVSLKIKNIELLDDSNNLETLEKKFLTYDSNNILEEPEGIIDENIILCETVNYKNIKKNEIKLHICNKIINKKTINMLEELQFYEKTIPNTNIYCWWCCNSFNSSPCGIPINYKESRFSVYGIFCSFNCALSYNKNSSITENKIFERESLIHMLYKIAYKLKNSDLEYAPPKETLKIFGGVLSIDEFRQNSKKYDIVYPPLIPIIPQIEENEYIDIDNEIKEKNNTIKNDNTLLNLFSKK